jgi:hypothetical protein
MKDPISGLGRAGLQPRRLSSEICHIPHTILRFVLGLFLLSVICFQHVPRFVPAKHKKVLYPSPGGIIAFNFNGLASAPTTLFSA